MKPLFTNLNKNPLGITLVLSGFLHLTGFYLLSDLTYDFPVKKAESIPIKIKVILKKEKPLQEPTTAHKALPVKKKTEALIREIARSPMPLKSQASIKRPSRTKAHATPSVLHASMPVSPAKQYMGSFQKPANINNPFARLRVARETTAIAFAENTAPTSAHIQTVSLRISSFAIPRKAESTHLFQIKNNHTNHPMVVHRNHSSSGLKNKHPSLHARTTTDFGSIVASIHIPARLASQRPIRPLANFKPEMRMASLASGFSEEYIEENKVSEELENNPANDAQFSALELGEMRQGFINGVRNQVTKAKYYPRVARKRGFEGNPIVAFTLGGKGKLIKLILAQPSDHKILNEAALETIRRGAPYPPIPEQLKEKSITFNLPISYILGEP